MPSFSESVFRILGMCSLLLWNVSSLPNLTTRNKKMFEVLFRRAWLVLNCVWAWMHGFVRVRSLLVLRTWSKLVVLPLWEGSPCGAGKAQFRPCWMHFCPCPPHCCVAASPACQHITVRESSFILLFPCPVVSIDVHPWWKCWTLALGSRALDPTAVCSLSCCNHCWTVVLSFWGSARLQVAAFCRMPAEEEVTWKEIININEDIKHWQTLTELGITLQSLSSLLASYLSELSDLSVIIIT